VQASDEIPYRIATVDDIPLLVDLINRAYVAEAEFVRGLRTDRLDMHAKISTPNTWFLVIDGPEVDGKMSLAGCVCVDCDGTRGHVGLLSVNPDIQGRGFGARLLRAAEEHCGQMMCCPIIELDVVSLRTELFGFYEHMGFTRTGEMPFPVEDKLIKPAHLVIMQKRSSCSRSS
jgi:ribosomal protein S18 acetylase RimI-like enzyme